MFWNIRALLKSHPVSGCLLLVVTLPVVAVIMSLLPPLAFFLVSWLMWTLYFYEREK